MVLMFHYASSFCDGSGPPDELPFVVSAVMHFPLAIDKMPSAKSCFYEADIMRYIFEAISLLAGK